MAHHSRLAGAGAIVIALAGSARAQSRNLDAVAGDKHAGAWQGWGESYDVKGDPSLQLVTTPALKTHWYDRWENPSADLFSSEKARNDRLAALGLPVPEIRDVGTFEGRPAMIVRRYPGAAYDPLHGSTDPAAFIANVDRRTTLPDLDALEQKLATLEKQGKHVDLSHLLITKDGHVLVASGRVDDGLGLPAPGDQGRNARVIAGVRKGMLLVKELQDTYVASSLDEARAIAADVLATSADVSKNPYAHAKVPLAKDEDPRVRAVVDAIHRAYGTGSPDEELRTLRVAREVVARHPSVASTSGSATATTPALVLEGAKGSAPAASAKPTKGASGTLDEALGGKKPH
jgi:hypothetical protein